MKKSHVLTKLVFVLSIQASAANAQSFKDALDMAFNLSPQIKAQQARLRAIDENLIQAKSAGLPNINLDSDIGALYTDRRSSNLTANDDFDLNSTNSVGLSLNQPIYQGGRVTGLKSEAWSQIMAGREELRDTEQSVLLNAATAYVDVIRDENLARLRRESVKVLSTELFAVQKKFDFGEGTRTDIAQTETRLQETRIGLLRAEASLNRSRAAFLRTIGTVPYDLETPPYYTLPETLEEAQSLARQNNPRLAASEYLVKAAEAAVDVSKSALRPTLGINTRVRTSDSEFNNLPRSSSAQLALQLNVPLYSGGLNRSRVRAAKETKTQLSFETRDLERSLDQSIANIWSQWEAAKEILVASQSQINSAETAFKGVKLEYGVGTRTALDVLNAEQELLDAELSLHQARRDVHASTYQLLAALGQLGAQ